MTTNFPSSLDNFTNPTSGDTLDSPDHAAQHADVNDAVEALQSKVGADSSAVTTSHDYKIAQLEAKSPTITLAGDASGSTTLTNLGNGTLTVTVNDDSHNHTIANVDNLQTTLDGKLPLSGGTLTGGLTVGGDLTYQNNAIISANGGSSNIDHIWHNDTTNAWNFCSDTTYKATGNSTLEAGNVNIAGNPVGLVKVFSGSYSASTVNSWTGIFDSAYANYLVILSGYKAVGFTSLYFNLTGGSGTPAWAGGGHKMNYGGDSTFAQFSGNMRIGDVSTDERNVVHLTLINPNQSARKALSGTAGQSGSFVAFGGTANTTNTYTGISVMASGGFTGGTIKVYGLKS